MNGWCYEEKDAWYSFKEQNPAEAQAISHLISSIWIQKAEQTDHILKGGHQVEVLMLRIACLLGLTTYDWSNLTFKFDPAIVKELAQTAFITLDDRKVSDE